MSKKHTYIIEGLNCANCAAKIVNSLKNNSLFNNVSLNFNTSKLTFTTSKEGFSEQQLFRIIKGIEPDIKIYPYKEFSSEGEVGIQENSLETKTLQEKNINWDFVFFCIGIFFVVLSLFPPHLSIESTVFTLIAVVFLLYKTAKKSVLILIRNKSIDENLLITISVIGAGLVGEHMEGLMVIILYSIGKMLEAKAINFSRKNIQNLMKIRPDYAIVLQDGVEKKVNPEEVQVGSIILVRPGEKVPLDGKVIKGSASLDTKHITGESIPRYIKTNEKVLSGSIVLDGVLEIIVESEYSNSTISRIMRLIEEASEKKSKAETFVSRFARWYTLGVIISSMLVFSIKFFLLNHSVENSVYVGLIFLVISCPCAFAISVPLSYFSGIGKASMEGILVKGSNYLDVCANLKSIAFDKTGTITTGNFEVKEIVILDKNYSKQDILKYAANGEQYSLHPIAKSIMEKVNFKLDKIENFSEIAGIGISYNIKEDSFFIGRDNNSKDAFTSVLIKKNQKEVGKIILYDKIKEEAKSVLQELKNSNIKTIMLSGDNKKICEFVSKETGIQEYKWNMLPQEKFKHIEGLLKQGKLAYIGDGINDAPALTLADVGISMGIAGSPATIEASDIVLANDNLTKISSLIKISKFTRKIVFQNIIFAMGTKLIFLVLGTLQITGMTWAVFADVGVTLIAILNSLRVINYNVKKQKSICKTEQCSIKNN